MSKEQKEIAIEYQFFKSPNAEEQMQQAIDLILSLILEDIQIELKNCSESEKC